MKRFKSALYLATAASIALTAVGAQAQTKIPFSPGQSAPSNPTDTGNASSVTAGSVDSLLGTGATSIQNVLRSECAAIGTNSPAWVPGGTGTATTGLQPNFACIYEEEGSGFGRQQWRSVNNEWTAASLPNSRFVAVSTAAGTGHVQFAFADSSLLASDLTTFNTNVKATAGDSIMFPKYVLPVAIAYAPVYGQNKNTGKDMSFHISSPVSIGGTPVGGMRLSHSLYCGIFNGDITNFNDSAFTTPNGGATLQDTVNDDATRWGNDGVPIRLVGRMEKSGTTDIFTRALHAQCTGPTNKYATNAETLPYNYSTSGVDFSHERPDTDLKNGGGANAGSTNSVGKEYFDTTTNSIQPSMNSLPGAPTSYPTGKVGSGLYLVAIGSGAVASAIVAPADYNLNGTILNGKIGYVASDYIANSPTGNAQLHAAALRTGASSGGFFMPDAPSAVLAMGTIAPPQATNSTSGVYDVSDTRKNRNGVTLDRADPLSWYDALYPTATTGLAQPSDGYPITGTTQFLGYRCYTQRNREHIVNLLGWETGAVTHDWQNVDHTGAIQGIVTASNIGNLPAGWAHAVNETFLTNSSEISGGHTLGSLNLWIQDSPLPGGNANSTCTVGMGM
ncbi:MAG: substrate-binding domain-containing protein [Sphingobium sp.]|nr:substrate-binding domain-containing protein [Sphingobium sp.]